MGATDTSNNRGKMTYFEMFAGAAGFGLGIDGECVGFSEIDKYASQVLKYLYKTKNYGDCKKINWSEVPDFDMLTGGSPCQDFSIAGKRAGIEGARSGLVWEYIRCLQEKKPRYFIWENVKGLLSSNSGRDFGSILIAFSESGYSLWWQVLNAKDFGVPQNRERVFVCGFRDGSPPEVFFERGNDAENSGGSGRETIPAIRATHYKSDDNQPVILNQNPGANQADRFHDPDGISPTIPTAGGGQTYPDDYEPTHLRPKPEQKKRA